MFRSIKTKLFFWYVFSLIIQALFFLLVVHILALPYGTQLFILLFLILSSIGFMIIFKITKSLSYLSFRIRQISRKNLHERIINVQSKDEIEELATSFNSLLDRIDEAFKREQQFIGDVAHELKTPLATLKTNLEITLSQNRSSDEYKNTIVEALDETNHISSTLKNVLDLTWSESSDKKQNSKKFNLTELLEEIYDIAKKMSEPKNISVTKSFENNIYISGHKDKLARAILNLIDNAVKYTQNQGTIELLLEKIPGKILINVKDNGKGISKEDLPNIFNRFYRGSKTDKVFGSGLGLAISKSIVNLHKGDIKVKSKTGQGSTFVVVLPHP